MLKEDLVSTIARRHPHLARGDVETVLDSVIETVNEVLAKGDRIRLTERGAVSAAGNRSALGKGASVNGRKDIASAIVDTLDEINNKIESIL